MWPPQIVAKIKSAPSPLPAVGKRLDSKLATLTPNTDVTPCLTFHKQYTKDLIFDIVLSKTFHHCAKSLRVTGRPTPPSSVLPSLHFGQSLPKKLPTASGALHNSISGMELLLHVLRVSRSKIADRAQGILRSTTDF